MVNVLVTLPVKLIEKVIKVMEVIVLVYCQ